MTILALALHILGAIVWVGGMFAIYMPGGRHARAAAAAAADAGHVPEIFAWVWAAILLLLASGYWMVFMTFGGMARIGLHVHLMQGIGWVMIALFAWLFHGPWLAFNRAVDAIPQIISVNLPLGLIVAIVGATGRYWG